MGAQDEEDIIYRVMIVDDSAFIRGAIARAIESDKALRIVSSVSNGEQAVKALRRDPVDVVVLDIEMPVMDGMTALPLLKEIDDAVQIIMASTLTQKNAEISLRAMSLGATDYIPKPSTGHEVLGAQEFKVELVQKIKALGALARRMGVRESAEEMSSPPTPSVQRSSPSLSRSTEAPSKKALPPESKTPVREKRIDSVRPIVAVGAESRKDVLLRKDAVSFPAVIAIGSSTGGPQALFNVVKDMGGDLTQPIVITQHMPASFTAILAEHIARQCGVVCTEARNGDVLASGHYYVAPGDYHMLIEDGAQGPTIKLVKDPPENFCRPAVDPMLRSLSKIYGRRLLVVILTGMGQDGMKGSQIVVHNGGAVIAQDEETSVVWGMPGAVATAGLCSAILPVAQIGSYVRQVAKRNGP